MEVGEEGGDSRLGLRASDERSAGRLMRVCSYFSISDLMDYLQTSELQPVASEEPGDSRKPVKPPELLRVLESDPFDGATALHVVAQRRDWPSVFACLEFLSLLCGNSGSVALNVNHQDLQGQTPLHVACALGNECAVSALLRWGADLEISDRNNFTPLHLACLHGHVQIAMEILEISDYTILSDYTSVRLAAACHPEILSLLHVHEMKNKDMVGIEPGRRLANRGQLHREQQASEAAESQPPMQFDRMQEIFTKTTDAALRASVAVARKLRARQQRLQQHQQRQ